MIKVRIMGLPNELKWFMKQMDRHRRIEVSNISDRLPVEHSKKYKRIHFEVEKKEED